MAGIVLQLMMFSADKWYLIIPTCYKMVAKLECLKITSEYSISVDSPLEWQMPLYRTYEKYIDGVDNKQWGWLVNDFQ